jgi:hypothetical protein
MSAPHKVLGVPKSATRDAVKSAFRRQALACHPDKHPGDRLAKKRWQDLVCAYEEYKRLWAQEDSPKAEPIPKAEKPSDPSILDEAASKVKDLSRPFATGMVGVAADFLKSLITKGEPGGVLSEIAGKAGQAAIDEAANKARAKLDEALKKE